MNRDTSKDGIQIVPVFKEFDNTKHTFDFEFPADILVYADQPGGIILATEAGYYRLERITAYDADED